MTQCRQENPRFDLLRLTERRYAASRKRAGWARSEVFGRWFRLTRQPGDDGFPVFHARGAIRAARVRPRGYLSWRALRKQASVNEGSASPTHRTVGRWPGRKQVGLSTSLSSGLCFW